ncbi:23S rRNA (uracil(1939)-C(5))-methyltransferase RlmD [Heliobacillus mobilis]|uniref:23S rRNA (Uracil(1939)-C(5))-methyltransferase RlmD n=1 Tax=Heliobacterium mobile TaxID=28064 RepID=A0A6I3SH15_HELMO|nr:23S rRNA (uracil(1939)-C(5))-methyltransferase RlmD [Heliobacterium mobile]MTV48144.1 23S rRNA (uracil(1939)-C(5))-methyltransferase RlmD [Heliobacterium mobile]
MKVGDIGNYHIERVTLQGEGVARPEGKVMFIPACLPGEDVQAKVTQVKKNYSRGELLKVVTPAKGRVDAPCPVFGVCGGCQLQMMDYPLQLSVKEEGVKDALHRLGRIKDAPVGPALGTDHPWRYRNRVQMHLQRRSAGSLGMGYYRYNSRELIEHDDCPLLPKSFPPVLKAVRSLIQDIDREGELPFRHLVLKRANPSEEIMLIFVLAEWRSQYHSKIKSLACQLIDKEKKLVSVYININQKEEGEVLGREYPLYFGKERLEEQMAGGLRLQIGPASFLQVNPRQTEELYRLTAEACALTGLETVIDAYCGVGSISLFLAKQCKKVVGVEEVEMAVEDARQNAALNGIENAEFLAGTVEDILPAYLKDGNPVNVVVLDPPRKGCHERVLDAIVDARPSRIVYVSCDPASLARDTSRLVERGWQIEQAIPVDMFPQTGHVETVCLLSK